MNNISVGDLIKYKSYVYPKGLICLVVKLDRIYNIPTKNYFEQYTLYCSNTKHKFRIWNSTCKNSSSLEKVN
jgi:hypothetical protein